MTTTTIYTNAKKLLAQRGRAKGQKRSALTRKIRKIADELCDNFNGLRTANCRGCQIENQLQG